MRLLTTGRVLRNASFGDFVVVRTSYCVLTEIHTVQYSLLHTQAIWYSLFLNISLISPEILEIAVKKLNVKILLNIAIYHYSRLYSVSIDSLHVKLALACTKKLPDKFRYPPYHNVKCVN